MDRYVLLISLKTKVENEKILELGKQTYEFLKEIATASATRTFPACSPSGSAAVQRWYFAIQKTIGSSQFCSSEWEDLGAECQKSDSEEAGPSALHVCHRLLRVKEDDGNEADSQCQAEIYEEAAEDLHQLSDKLPAPGKALLDVVILAPDNEPPGLKEFLPVLGSLKHMQTWHSAKITLVTDNSTGWQKVVSYLSAEIRGPDSILSCVDVKELWRGSILIRERKSASELRFGAFCLRERPSNSWSGLLSGRAPPESGVDRTLRAEVFQYFQPVLDLVQLVSVPDLPIYLHSHVEFDLGLTTRSRRSRLLLDQLSSLRGQVGALFSLSCTLTSLAVPPALQLSSHKWRELMARKPQVLPVPEVEVKGESVQYFWLVQGTHTGGCTARMLHSASQINGAAAMATTNELLQEKDLALSGSIAAEWLQSLPCLYGDQLLRRDMKLEKVQALAIKECVRRREEAKQAPLVPLNELKVLMSLAREQYLKMHDSHLPRVASFILEMENSASRGEGVHTRPACLPDWPERSVLKNLKDREKFRQKTRYGLLLAGGSSECLLGPKESQKGAPTLLDAKELLRHFTPEGHPSGELQPLPIHRGEHTFQLSTDLTPRKVTQLPFSKAASSHYHGIEFCLDERRALERDRGLLRLQSRLIRYETYTTCSKEPCPVPFALSPAPSPAVLSEPGSVPDGEALMSEARGDPPRLKRKSWDADGTHTLKRLVKSESSESLGSRSSRISSVHPAVRALQGQPRRAQSTSEMALPTCPAPGFQQDQGKDDRPVKESRSQKHHRMLKEVVMKTLQRHSITSEHVCFEACSERLFEISKLYLKDLKTSRGLHDEMKKAANNNCQQVIAWVLEKTSKK